METPAVETGVVVKLDRGFPLVRLGDGRELRCEHATSLVKGSDQRAVVGDAVRISLPDGHDKGIIEETLPRRTSFVRKDPTERALPQTLAANFDLVIIAQPIEDINTRRLERELVLAHETGALIGRSGVGKSSLVNMLVGSDIQKTTAVRGDGKGRHTTVSREIIYLPTGGRIIDMPGVRGLGLWDADEGIGAAFSDIEEIASSCRFRDCTHTNEPGCAVRAAVESGDLAAERLESYVRLREESAQVKTRREEAERIRSRRGHPRRRR